MSDATAGPPPARRPVIEIGYEFVAEANVDQVFLVAALAVLDDLPLAGNIRIVVTSRMPESLALRVNEQYCALFTQRRTIGRVTAKTVSDGASSTEILLDAAALLPDVRSHLDGGIERLLRHEGRHLVLRDRGEDANACVRALGELDPARKTFAWMAALAVEEYRIESALCQAEHQATPYDEQLPPVLAEWLAIVEEAGASWGPDKAVPIIQTTSEIITRCAYVAAEEHFGTPLKAAVTESEEWRYLVGDCWPRLLAVMKDLPCADVSLSEDELTSKVRDVAALVQEWCDAIGFELSSEDGDLCVMPLNEVASLAA